MSNILDNFFDQPIETESTRRSRRKKKREYLGNNKLSDFFTEEENEHIEYVQLPEPFDGLLVTQEELPLLVPSNWYNH